MSTNKKSKPLSNREVELLGQLADAMSNVVKFGERFVKIAKLCENTDLDAVEKVTAILKTVPARCRKIAKQPELLKAIRKAKTAKSKSKAAARVKKAKAKRGRPAKVKKAA